MLRTCQCACIANVLKIFSEENILFFHVDMIYSILKSRKKSWLFDTNITVQKLSKGCEMLVFTVMVCVARPCH